MQKQITPAEIAAAHAALKKHGTNAAAARALGMPRSTFERRLKHPTAPPVAVERKVGKGLSDFRAQHDKDFIVPKKIKTALDALGSGWEYELEFSRLAGVSATDLNLYREQFADYWLVIGRSGKRAWAGSKSTAESMRAMVRG